MKEISQLVEFFKVYGWTKGAWSRNEFGGVVQPQYKHATRFCLTGAILRLKLPAGFTRELLGMLNTALGTSYTSVAEFNDEYIENKQHLIEILEKLYER